MFWKDQKIKVEWEKGETWLTLSLGSPMSQVTIFMNPEDARLVVGAINEALDQ